MSMEGDIERSRERALMDDLRDRGILGREGWLSEEDKARIHPNQRRFVEDGWKGGSHVQVPTDELPRRVPRDPESVRNEQEVRRAAAELKPKRSRFATEEEVASGDERYSLEDFLLLLVRRVETLEAMVKADEEPLADGWPK